MKSNISSQYTALNLSETDATLNFLWLELTEKCNLQCVHCYANSKPQQPLERFMRYRDWCNVMRDARALGCSRIQFIGGEVALVPYLKELVSEATALGFQFIEIFTNATLLDDDLLDFLADAKVELATSFYCSVADIHDQVTQRRGSWQRTVDAIERIQARKLPLRVGIIEMDINRDYVSETINFLREHGIENVGVDRVRSVGRAQVLTAVPPSLHALCGKCGNGRVCVNSSGDVLPCIMARSHPLGNINTERLASIISSNKLGSFREQLKIAKHGNNYIEVVAENACTPDCWPHGGCSPHDICKPSK